MPATGWVTGTPASIIERQPPQTLAIEDEPKQPRPHRWDPEEGGHRVAGRSPGDPQGLGPDIDGCREAGDTAGYRVGRARKRPVVVHLCDHVYRCRGFQGAVDAVLQGPSGQAEGLGGVVAGPAGHDAQHGGRSGYRPGRQVHDAVSAEGHHPLDACRYRVVGGRLGNLGRRRVED